MGEKRKKVESAVIEPEPKGKKRYSHVTIGSGGDLRSLGGSLCISREKKGSAEQEPSPGG